MEAENDIYLVVLAKGVDSPLKALSDEEVVASDAGDEGAGAGGSERSDAEAGGEGADEAAGDQSEDSAAEDDEDPVQIDFENLDQRIIALPIPSANHAGLEAGAPGQLYYGEITGGGNSVTGIHGRLEPDLHPARIQPRGSEGRSHHL